MLGKYKPNVESLNINYTEYCFKKHQGLQFMNVCYCVTVYNYPVIHSNRTLKRWFTLNLINFTCLAISKMDFPLVRWRSQCGSNLELFLKLDLQVRLLREAR